MNADVVVPLGRRWSIQASVFNLLDAKVADIDYFYASRLPGEPLEGVDDVHTHPSAPRTLRVGLSASF